MPPCSTTGPGCEGLSSEKWSARFCKTNWLTVNARKNRVESTLRLCDGNNVFATRETSDREWSNRGVDPTIRLIPSPSSSLVVPDKRDWKYRRQSVRKSFWHLRPRDMPLLWQPSPPLSQRSHAEAWELESGRRQGSNPTLQGACACAPQSAGAYDDRSAGDL